MMTLHSGKSTQPGSNTRLRPRIASLALVLGAVICTPALAQERPNTILVLDGSGSMWGQIDGVNKITIARDVVADILKDFPANENLGLVAYGHRQRGQCSDIETLVAPAPGTAAEITRLVKGLNPRGMTPMTDAVISAATSLRYTEQAAAVILVSDGIETCHVDPCAAARALAEAGVAFTTHVIGFDVKGEAEALTQMQCMAEETGGRFLTADNAQQLNAALKQVVTAGPGAQRQPEPEKTRQTATALLSAVDAAPAGSVIEVAWEGPDAPHDNVMIALPGSDREYSFTYTSTGNPVKLQLPAEPGQYELRYQFRGNDGEIIHTRPIEVTEVELALRAPASAPAGSVVEVHWSGPGAHRDNVQIAPPGGGKEYSWTYTRSGNPARVQLPMMPGTYELRYQFLGDVGKAGEIIHTHPIEVTPTVVTIDAPATAAAGSTLEVHWQGPDAAKDNIQVARAGGRYIHWTNTRDGNPVRLKMPDVPGDYEIRYRFRDVETVATRTITVTP